MSVVFFTGFPGFLGSELLPRVLLRAPETEGVCLVQPRFAGAARARRAEIVRAHPGLRGRIRLLEGDVTRPGLGLEGAGVLRGEVVQVYHLAAVYDLSVGPEPAHRVNVEGTRHVLDFARGCPGLSRLHYVSTCYVSGRHPGVFTEDDLEVGQSFNNHYERTKHLAEVEVQRAMREGLPATIYRPSVVVGDSVTGATQKYDGPYFVIRWLLRQPRVALMPVVGDPGRTEFNVVPRDFVVDAMTYLSGLPGSEGRVYQLCDPRAPTVDELLRDLARATRRRVVRIPLPLRVAKGAIEHVPGVYRLMRIPSAAVDYFVHPTLYRNPRTLADLEGSGLRVPPFREYARRLVDFVRAHPGVGSAAMV